MLPAVHKKLLRLFLYFFLLGYKCVQGTFVFYLEGNSGMTQGRDSSNFKNAFCQFSLTVELRVFLW